MALKNCKECGNLLSDKAEICPSCGYKNKKQVPLWMTIGIIFIAFVFVGSCVGNNNNQSTTSSTTANDTIRDTVKSNWITNVSKDEMRGTEIVNVATESTNKVNFNFPYNGGSSLLLLVRRNDSGNDVIIRITKGQFLCSSFDGCEVNFKFDQSPIQSITMVGAESHDSDILFVKHNKTTASLINKIKSSKTVIVEPNFYQEGKHQFTFNLEGFKEP